MKARVKSRVILFLSIGFALGVLYSFGGFFVDVLVTLGWVTSTETSGLSYGTLLAFGALVGMSFVGALFGFVVGVVEVFVVKLLKR